MEKKIIIYALTLCMISCGGGDPSVSIQPSEEFFDAKGTQLTAKMDILFVIDNSVSMRQEQENMMANFTSFIKNFVGKGYDYRIATAATDAWITKGFYDTRTTPPVTAIDANGFVLMADHISDTDEYNPNNFVRADINYNTDSVIELPSSNPSYAGPPDLRFWNSKGGNDYYKRICNRENYVTSRFAEGDYTKALLGSAKGTANGEASGGAGTANPDYLSVGYRIVSSEDSTIDTDFYGEEESEDFVLLVNRDKSFYDADIANETKPNGKEHILDIFRNNIMLGLDGCYGESGLESARTVLENPFNQSIDGKAFPRSDAHLAIIIVSDMRDEMAGVRNNSNPTNVTVANYSLGSDTSDNFSQERLDVYKSYFESISSDAFGYSVHVIVPTGTESVDLGTRYDALIPPEFISTGLDCTNDDPFNNTNCYVATDKDNGNVKVTNDQIQPDISCSTEWKQNLNGTTVPREAKMYTKMAEQTGGQKATICGDFAEKLEKIAQVIIERTTEVKLDKLPKDVDLLFVSIDYSSDDPDQGFVDIPQDAENGWTYNAVGNTVVFNGDSIPDQNAQISIVFDRDSLE